MSITAHVVALPVPVNLSLYQGDDFFLDLVVNNPDGTPAALGGVTPTATIKSGPPSSVTATFAATVAGNLIHLHLPASESAKLTAPAATWDCQIASTDVPAHITTLVAGKVSVAAQVTV